MWHDWHSALKSTVVVLFRSDASNHDQPQPSPHSLFPGCVFLLSLVMTNHPFRVCARLTVPVVISDVAVSKTSFTKTVPSGKGPSFFYAAMWTGGADTARI